MGHFILGVGLARLGHFHRAILAFETVVSMAPGFLNAHRWLIALNSRPGGDLAKAAQYRKLLQALIEWRRAATTASPPRRGLSESGPAVAGPHSRALRATVK
jgi:hypothetical protein